MREGHSFCFRGVVTAHAPMDGPTTMNIWAIVNGLGVSNNNKTVVVKKEIGWETVGGDTGS